MDKNNNIMINKNKEDLQNRAWLLIKSIKHTSMHYLSIAPLNYYYNIFGTELDKIINYHLDFYDVKLIQQSR